MLILNIHLKSKDRSCGSKQEKRYTSLQIESIPFDRLTTFMLRSNINNYEDTQNTKFILLYPPESNCSLVYYRLAEINLYRLDLHTPTITLYKLQTLQMRARKRKNNASANNQHHLDQPEIYQTPNSHHHHKNKNKQSSHFSSSEQDQNGAQLEDQEDGGSKRQNTLTILTKRFTKLIKSKENFILDINQATRELGVQKRRIYDITNVLQGIGYIQKIHKNKMKWVGGTMDLQVAKQVDQLDQQIDELIQKNRQIDQEMIQLTYKLKKQTQNKKELNYFLEQDLRQILQNAPGNPNCMIVIKAVEGSIMEVQGNKLIIQKEVESDGEMHYLTLTKKDKDDCFSIIK